jgi:hypothetical protein
MNLVEIVYLARYSNGLGPVRRFLDSYLAHDAGLPHSLGIICKGFPADLGVEAEVARAGLSPRFFRTSDAGMDIGAYIACARTVTAQFVCFLNSYSEINAHGWLAKLMAPAQQPGVGVSGATGSFESLCSSLVNDMAREWRSLVGSPRTAGARMRLLLHAIRRFPGRPNPHLRTNGFVIRPSLFQTLSLKGPGKDAALQFEGGYASMTRQLRRRGLVSVVVGADGRIFAENDWPESQTFRYLDQSNLLIHDNQTRRYQNANMVERDYLGKLAWGSRFR